MVFVAVLVVAPGAVAALGIWNAAVGVIKPVNESTQPSSAATDMAFMLPYERGVDLVERIVAMLSKLIDP